mmetsp:Transcript_436/g.678  ORF Transcript_436/g.678 Transcript_436/m.678 type:complete len:360 (-) Transcript_436:189-1268(-)
MADILDDYQKTKEPLGRGTFGVVYEYIHKKTGEKVAVKKLRVSEHLTASSQRDGVHFSAIREIKIQRELNHPNICSLKHVFHRKFNINLMFEFCVTDLEKIIKDTRLLLDQQHVKGFMSQILKGVDYLHSSWILHRDIKPGNMLVSSEGVLKLTDFGFGRYYGSPRHRMSPQVVTLWYKPPELIFGARSYGTGVDMWSVGCVFAELMLRTPYLPGESEIDQLSKIFGALGVPTEADWPGMKDLPCYVEFKPYPAPPMRQLFSAVSEATLDLLSKFLLFDPSKRICAKEAITHKYFLQPPLPSAQHELPLPVPKSASSNSSNSSSSSNPPLSPKMEGARKRKIPFNLDVEQSPSTKRPRP